MKRLLRPFPQTALFGGQGRAKEQASLGSCDVRGGTCRPGVDWGGARAGRPAQSGPGSAGSPSTCQGLVPFSWCPVQASLSPVPSSAWSALHPCAPRNAVKPSLPPAPRVFTGEQCVLCWLTVHLPRAGGSDGKERACPCRRPGFIPVWGRFPRRRNWPLTLVFLPGESHRSRSLAGYSPWGRRVTDY